MEFKEFEKILFFELINNNKKKCTPIIENNKKLLHNYFCDNNNIINFVNKLNEHIVNYYFKKYTQFEEVLKHPIFKEVLTEFKKSDILIKACQAENKKALKWLITMNINLFTQDDQGMTALMHAVKSLKLDFVVDFLIKKNDDSILLTDNKGRTALFHAIGNYDMFKKLLSTKIDVNHQDQEGDTVFISCCKDNKNNPQDYVIILTSSSQNMNPNIINKEGNTGIIYLVENAWFRTLNFIKHYNHKYPFSPNKFDIYVRNSITDESILYIFFRKLNEIYSDKELYKTYEKHRLDDYISTLISLKSLGIDLNNEIDREGNTPMMYFMMKKDFASIHYLLKYYRGLNFSIQNRKGISSTFLSLFLLKRNTKVLLENHMAHDFLEFKYFINHKSFDFTYIDPQDNNLLIHFIVRDDFKLFSKVLYRLLGDDEIINYPNKQHETALIVAVKLGRRNYLTATFLKSSKINHQDNYGNTALYYAVKLKDKTMIQRLLNYHANTYLPNFQGQTAIDLAEILKEDSILEMLTQSGISDYHFSMMSFSTVSTNSDESSLENSDPKKNKILSFFKGKKSKVKKEDKEEKDEKLESYIQNYQISNNQNEYNSLLVNIFENDYAPIIPRNRTFLESHLYGIYVSPYTSVLDY
ncbi:hypothetical protein PIROE2DRAFT_14251 [Piromyces sp. E2]|nr:hypothetical protein PIROE2DRAFT_14251 [Piromyces sp. E2]|eukprot:OUM60060.1 hypothetical protein PIROE2DRAFT_14251 [Piromyces sp. E2]